MSRLFGNLGLQSRWNRDGVVDGVSMRVVLRGRVHLEGGASELGFSSGGEEVFGWRGYWVGHVALVCLVLWVWDGGLLLFLVRLR